MSNLQIYVQDRQSLTEISFVKSVSSHLRMRDADGYELSKEIAHWFAHTSNSLGIKEEINSINKMDITEMLLSKYKALSVDELYYAFKMERYGNLGEKTQHFQLFNASYVSDVLEKYREWKRNIKVEHNISQSETKPTTTDQEKTYWINRAVNDCLDYFETHRELEDGKFYVYDILYEDGFLPTDVEYKKRIKNDAIELIDFELKNKKPVDLSEKKKIRDMFENLYSKNNPLVVLKCKELALAEFLRKATLDHGALQELRDKYKF